MKRLCYFCKKPDVPDSELICNECNALFLEAARKGKEAGKKRRDELLKEVSNNEKDMSAL